MPYAQLKQNDEVTLDFQLTDADGRPTDLTSDTVYITLYFNGGEEVDATGTVPSVDDVEVTDYVDRDQGRVSHDFGADAFENAGTYLAEFEVDNGSESQYYPKVRFFDIEVDSRLDVISAGQLGSSGTLAGNLDANDNNITNGGTFEADVGRFGILEDRSSGNQVDIDTLISGFPSVSEGGSQRVAASSDFNFTGAVDVTADGDGTATIDITATGGGAAIDFTDGATVLSDPSELLFQSTGAASVDIDDDGDGTGRLLVGATDTDTHIDVQDDGAALATDISTLNLGSNVSGSVSGSTVTVSTSGGGTSSSATATTVTKSGDGSTASFTLNHGFGTDAVTVYAATEDASTDFWVSSRTDNAVTVEYATALPNGTDNLAWIVTAGAGGTGVTSHDGLSDDVQGASSVDNSGSTFIQDLTFDPHGHVTAVTSADAGGGGASGGGIQRFTEFLDPASGDSPSRRWGMFIADGETVELRRAAIAVWDDTGSFTTDAGVELNWREAGSNDVTIDDAGALDVKSGSPLESWTNNSGSAQFGYVEVENTTANSYTAFGEFLVVNTSI